MRWLVICLVACTAPTAPLDPAGPDAATPKVDAPIGGDATHADGSVDIDAAVPSDAPATPDAPTVACDTITSMHTVGGGDVVTTCLATDQDVDTYRFVAPADASGGLLRFKVEFADCQIAFSLWTEIDMSFAMLKTDDSFDTIHIGQLDHNMVQIVAPGSAYRLKVFKRRPFAGSCNYTLTTGYTPIADPYEPNDDAATAKTVSVGTPATAYLACVTPERDPSIDDCEDVWKFSLPAGTYNMSYSLPSAPTGINPCLTVVCVRPGTSTTTYNYFQCQAAGGGAHGFGALFNVTEQSSCIARMHGSTAGFIATGRVEPFVPNPPWGADQPYTFGVAIAPP